MVDSDGVRLDVAASFYAAAYQDASGNIVISYRGTDALGDVTAWTGGAGFQTAQAELAAQFYDQVQQAHPGASIALTGHSLGGALAGLIAKLKNRCCVAARHPNPGYQIPNAHDMGVDFK